MTSKKKKLKIGIDIDNVISDSFRAILGKFNQTFRTNVIYEEIFDFYYLEKYAGVKEETVKEFLREIIVNEQFQLKNILPYQGAKESVDKWRRFGHSIHYITSRPKTAKKVTNLWLKKHGFLVKDATVDIFNEKEHHRLILPQILEYKKGAVVKIGIDMLIEDSREIAEIMDIPVFLFNRPWNQGKLAENIIRVNDWFEVDKIISSR